MDFYDYEDHVAVVHRYIYFTYLGGGGGEYGEGCEE